MLCEFEWSRLSVKCEWKLLEFMLILCDTLNILYMYIAYTKNEGNIIKNNNFICLFIYCVLFFLNISLLYFHNSEMPFLRKPCEVKWKCWKKNICNSCRNSSYKYFYISFYRIKINDEKKVIKTKWKVYYLIIRILKR